MVVIVVALSLFACLWRIRPGLLLWFRGGDDGDLVVIEAIPEGYIVWLLGRYDGGVLLPMPLVGRTFMGSQLEPLIPLEFLGKVVLQESLVGGENLSLLSCGLDFSLLFRSFFDVQFLYDGQSSLIFVGVLLMF